MVQGYKIGGTVPKEPSIEQRVAELAAQQGISVPAARAMILKQMLEQQGVTLPEEVINQFATGLITLHEALSQAVEPAGKGALRRAVGEGILGAGAGGAFEGATEVPQEIQGMQGGGVALDLVTSPDVLCCVSYHTQWRNCPRLSRPLACPKLASAPVP